MAAAVRDGAADDRREPAGGDHRRFTARLDQRPRDAAREALLAVLEDRIREIALVGLGDEIGGGVAAAAIHAHVERLVALEAEAAPRLVELHRRDAEIGERAVDVGDPAAVELVADRAVVGVDQLDAIAPRRERVAGARQRVEIAVEADHPRGAGLEQRARVAAEPDRAVDEQPAPLGAEMLEDLGGHHRDVLRHQMPNSDSALASSSVYGSRCSFACSRS